MRGSDVGGAPEEIRTPDPRFIVWGHTFAVGTDFSSPTGSPEAVARLRFPQNVACGFPAPRSSAVGSQHCKSLQLPVREAQLWFQQRCPFFDLVEAVPTEATAIPAAAAQHLTPVTFHDLVHFDQRPEIPGDAVIGIVAAQGSVDLAGLITDRVMPYSPHQLLQRQKAAPQTRFLGAHPHLEV